MRSLSPESSRKPSHLVSTANENTASTQYGILHHGLPSSPGSLSQGQSEEIHNIPESWDDLASTDGGSGTGQSRDESSKLRQSSVVQGDLAPDYERTTSSSKAASDGLLFRVVRSSSKGGSVSPIANLPNGMFTSFVVTCRYSWANVTILSNRDFDSHPLSPFCYGPICRFSCLAPLP